jgi:hypothetical protein
LVEVVEPGNAERRSLRALFCYLLRGAAAAHGLLFLGFHPSQHSVTGIKNFATNLNPGGSSAVLASELQCADRATKLGRNRLLIHVALQ